jgi:hypothetical protein
MSARMQRRWIVLGQDGRHVTLGRVAPPSAAEVAAASEAMAAQGLAGWIATLDGNYWSRRRVKLSPVQSIGAEARQDWRAAVAAFDATRRTAVTLR